MIFLLVAAAVVVGAPLLAAMLVTIASLHEDSARSLNGRPPGMLAAAARRLLSFRSGTGLAVSNRSGWRSAQSDRAARLGSRQVPAPRQADDEDADSRALTLPRS